jgi:hypothetical protein
MQDDAGEKAFEELRDHIAQQNSGGDKFVDFAEQMVSPVGALGKLAKGAVGLGKAAPAATTVGRAANTALNAGIAGGISSTAQSNNDQELSAGLSGAATGAAVGAVLDPVMRGVGRTVAKTFGAKPQSVDRYLADPKGVKGAKTVAELAEDVSTPLRKLEFERAMEGEKVKYAKQAYDSAVRGLEDRLKVQGTAVGDDAVEAVTAAKKALREKIDADVAARFESLAKMKALPPPEVMAQNILENKVPKVEGAINLGAMKKVAKDALNRRKIAGMIPDSDPEVQAIREITALPNTIQKRYLNQPAIRTKLEELSTLAKAGDKVAAAEMKRVRNSAINAGRQLDPEDFNKLKGLMESGAADAYARQTGSKLGGADRGAMKLSREMRKSLNETIPGMQESGSEISKKINLMDDVIERFSDDANLYKKLPAAGDPGNVEAMRTLQALQEMSGVPVLDKIQPALQARATQASQQSMDAAYKKLPEYQQLQDLLASKATKDSNAARIGGVISADNADKAITRLANRTPKRPEVALTESLKGVSDVVGRNLEDDIANTTAALDFAAAGPQGSRLTTMFQGAGEAVGGKTGKAIMGAVGATADYARGRIARGALDVYLQSDKVSKAIALQLGPVIDVLGNSQDPAADKYAKTLDEASKRGPQAMMATHATLMKTDPKYKELTEAQQPQQDLPDLNFDE